jgi:tripartite-type tricarboxylate transporter receptor subunit TctC
VSYAFRSDFRRAVELIWRRRIVANRLSEIWGQQVVVDNKPGFGGNIALDTAADAVPDAYTMVLATSAPAIYGLLLGSTELQTGKRSRTPMIWTYTHLMVVTNDSAIKSVRDYVDAAKAKPGKMTFASPGVGTSGHLSGELLKRMAGLDIVHVPYRGVAAGSLSDVITGRVDLYVQHHWLTVIGRSRGTSTRACCHLAPAVSHHARVPNGCRIWCAWLGVQLLVRHLRAW